MRLRQSIATPDRFDESVFKNKRRDLTKPFFPQLLASQVVAFDPSRPSAVFPSLPIAVTSTSNRDRPSNNHQFSPCHDQDEECSVDLNSQQDFRDGEKIIWSTEEIVESIEATETLKDTCVVCHKQMRVEWKSLALATQVHIFSFFLQLQKYAEVVATTLKLTHQELEEIKNHMSLRKIYQAPLEDIWAYGSASSDLGSGIIDPDKINDVMDYLLFASRYEVTNDVDTRRGKQFLKQLGFADYMMDLFEDYGRKECPEQAVSTRPPSPELHITHRRSSMRNDLRIKTMQANLDKARSTTLSAPPSITTFADRHHSRTPPSDHDPEQPKTKRICLSIDKNGLASIVRDRTAKDSLRRTTSLPTSMLKRTSKTPLAATNRSISLGNSHIPRITEKDCESQIKLPVLGYFKPTSTVSSRKSSLGMRSEGAGPGKDEGNILPERRLDANDKVDTSAHYDDHTGQSAAGIHWLMATTNSNALVQSHEGYNLEKSNQQRGQPAEDPETPENRRPQVHTGDTTIDVLSGAEAVFQQTADAVEPNKICHDFVQDIVSPEQDAVIRNDTVDIAEVIDRLLDTVQAGVAADKEHQNESSFSTAPSYSPISDQDPESLPSWARYDTSGVSKDEHASFSSPRTSPQLSFQRRAATEMSQNKFLQNMLDVAAQPILETPSAEKEGHGSPIESPGPLKSPAIHDSLKEQSTSQTLSPTPLIKAHDSSSSSTGQESKTVKDIKIHYPVTSMVSVDIPFSRLQNINRITPCPTPLRSNEDKQDSTTRKASQKQNDKIKENNSTSIHATKTTEARADNQPPKTKATTKTFRKPSQPRPTKTPAPEPTRSNTTNPAFLSQPKPKPQPTKHTGPSSTSSTLTAKIRTRTTRSRSNLPETPPTTTSTGPNTIKRRSDFGRKRGSYKSRKSTKVNDINAGSDEDETHGDDKDEVEGVHTRARGKKT